MKALRKIIVLGVGSIGTRHLTNLGTLRPDVKVVMADPKIATERSAWTYADWRMALDEHQDADGVIVASPTDQHLAQLESIFRRGLTAYVEKPLTSIGQWTASTREMLTHCAYGIHAAIGFQYRYGPAGLKWTQYRAGRQMDFTACDNLVERYGPHVLEIMGSHAIDLALWMLGPALQVDLETDGVKFIGSIKHFHGVSRYRMKMDGGERTSTINGEPNNIDNSAYLGALEDWLLWIERGTPSEPWEKWTTKMATLSDGIAVMDVMAQAIRTN